VATVTAPRTVRRRGNPVTDFFTGIGLMLRGQALVLRSPGLWFLGLIPAMIAFLLLAGAFVGLAMYDQQIATFLTPFAEHWATWLKDAIRLAVEAAVIVVFVVAAVLVYTSLTLIIGEPFYEAISKRVDDRLGGIRDERSVSFWRQLPRSIVEATRLLLRTGFNAILVVIVTLIPVAGPFMGPVLGAFIGGWAIALELTSVPFERRGLVLRHRRSVLRARRSMTLGFGVATFVALLIPAVDVLLTPGAVAGATLLSRRVFGDLEQAAP
jgi:CysZ protein